MTAAVSISSGTEAPNAATMIIANSLLGIEISVSIPRLSTASSQPPLTAASIARQVPMALAASAATSATATV